MADEPDKALRAREMRDLAPHVRDLSIGTSDNVVDARRVLAERRVERIMRTTEDDCA